MLRNQWRVQGDACQAPAADELWLPGAHWAAMDAACVLGRCWLRNTTYQLSLPLTGACTLALEAQASGLPNCWSKRGAGPQFCPQLRPDTFALSLLVCPTARFKPSPQHFSCGNAGQ